MKNGLRVRNPLCNIPSDAPSGLEPHLEASTLISASKVLPTRPTRWAK